MFAADITWHIVRKCRDAKVLRLEAIKNDRIAIRKEMQKGLLQNSFLQNNHFEYGYVRIFTEKIVKMTLLSIRGWADKNFL